MRLLMEKKYLTKGLLGKIVVCFGIISIVLYFAAYHQIYYNAYEQIQSENDGNIGSIIDNAIVSQYFQYNGDYIRTIDVKVGTYARTNEGVINITLKSVADGKIIWEGEQNLNTLEDNSDMSLPVNKEIVNGKAEFLLEFQSEGCTQENSITMYTKSANKVHHGELSVNGERIDAELEMSVYGDKRSTWGEYYWGYVLIILIIIVIIYMRQEKKEKNGKDGWLHNWCYTLNTYEFMMKQLISRDFKTKYKRSVLGMCWSFLNPLLTMIVQYVVFSTLFRGNIRNYPVYLLSASILFSFFTEAVGGGLISIVGNASLIKKVYAPKYIYPVTKVLSTSINLLISLVPLLVVILITGERVNKAYLLIPYVLVCLIIFCVGMSLILSSLMVFFRDVQFLWSIVSLLWMYATPMFYPESIIPGHFHFVFDFNPMYHYITFFRTIILNYSSPRMSEYVCCAAFSLLFCMIGVLIFSRTQKRFVLYL